MSQGPPETEPSGSCCKPLRAAGKGLVLARRGSHAEPAGRSGPRGVAPGGLPRGGSLLMGGISVDTSYA
jgi:hypothetical protein